MGWRTMVCTLLLAACGDNRAVPDAAPDTAPADAAVDARTCLTRATYSLMLAAGAFPGTPDHPDVVVFVPDGFDPAPPVDVVVYVHGSYNCAANVLGAIDGPCTSGGANRAAAHLAAQLETSARNALLVIPEVMADSPSADPGALGTSDGFKALLDESLAAIPLALAPGDVGKVIVASHSTGYAAVAPMITDGGIDVDEVWLLDSLYGQTSAFDSWVMADLTALVAPTRRFADIYTTSAGTQTNSHAMADRAATWVSATPSVLVDDRSTATWPDATYRHGLLFKLASGATSDLPRTYVERLLATSSLASISCP